MARTVPWRRPSRAQRRARPHEPRSSPQLPTTSRRPMRRGLAATQSAASVTVHETVASASYAGPATRTPTRSTQPSSSSGVAHHENQPKVDMVCACACCRYIGVFHDPAGTSINFDFTRWIATRPLFAFRSLQTECEQRSRGDPPGRDMAYTIGSGSINFEPVPPDTSKVGLHTRITVCTATGPTSAATGSASQVGTTPSSRHVDRTSVYMMIASLGVPS